MDLDELKQALAQSGLPRDVQRQLWDEATAEGDDFMKNEEIMTKADMLKREMASEAAKGVVQRTRPDRLARTISEGLKKNEAILDTRRAAAPQELGRTADKIEAMRKVADETGAWPEAPPPKTVVPAKPFQPSTVPSAEVVAARNLAAKPSSVVAPPHVPPPEEEFLAKLPPALRARMADILRLKTAGPTTEQYVKGVTGGEGIGEVPGGSRWPATRAALAEVPPPVESAPMVGQGFPGRNVANLEGLDFPAGATAYQDLSAGEKLLQAPEDIAAIGSMGLKRLVAKLAGSPAGRFLGTTPGKALGLAGMVGIPAFESYAYTHGNQKSPAREAAMELGLMDPSNPLYSKMKGEFSGVSGKVLGPLMASGDAIQTLMDKVMSPGTKGLAAAAPGGTERAAAALTTMDPSNPIWGPAGQAYAEKLQGAPSDLAAHLLQTYRQQRTAQAHPTQPTKGSTAMSAQPGPQPATLEPPPNQMSDKDLINIIRRSGKGDYVNAGMLSQPERTNRLNELGTAVQRQVGYDRGQDLMKRALGMYSPKDQTDF